MTTTFDFESFMQGHRAGRSNLATAMRQLTIAAAVGSADFGLLQDEAFLEPRLIAWHFGASCQLLSLAQAASPALRAALPSPMAVRADAEGNVLLAGGQSLLTGLPNANLTLQRTAGALRMLDPDGSVVPAEAAAHATVAAACIELVGHCDPVIACFFRDHVDCAVPLTIAPSPRQYLPAIGQALETLRSCVPAFHAALLHSLRAIVLMKHPSANSLAALGMHGMIFLNLRRQATLAFFIDGLVHQGGHVIFSEATLERPAFFQLSPDTPLESVTTEPDGRSIYEALHGLYTEHALVEAMDRARLMAALSPLDALELNARTGFILWRMGTDLRRLEPHAQRIFSPTGKALFEHFRHSHRDALARRCEQPAFDFSGQPDEFDLDHFLQRNVVPTAA